MGCIKLDNDKVDDTNENTKQGGTIGPSTDITIATTRLTPPSLAHPPLVVKHDKLDDTNENDEQEETITPTPSFDITIATQPLTPSSLPHPPSIKHVRFNYDGDNSLTVIQTIHFVPHLSTYSPMTKQEYWWSQNELTNIRYIKNGAIQRDYPSEAKYITTAYSACAVLDSSSRLQIQRQQKQATKALDKWCRSVFDFRGLEAWSSAQYRRSRELSYKRLKAQIFALQEQKGIDPEDIRMISEQFSRTTLQFALKMAAADADIVKSMTDTSRLQRWRKTTSNGTKDFLMKCMRRFSL